jgi:serine-type D-Ala-D-Ala carboxypeptidase/endopeptidase
MILKMKSVFFLIFFFPALLQAEKDQAIQRQLEETVEHYLEDHDITGISVAVIGRENLQKFQKTISKGKLSKKSPIPVNNHTEFRLGPLSQIFIASVLAYFVNEGQLSLNDPVSKFLPKSMKVPTYKGKQMTLGDLATHTSGLPDMPYSLSSRASFSVSQMYRFLSKYELTREPGTKYEYSYFGYAFLSNLLSRIAKRSYPDLAQQMILEPLHMKDTVFNISQDQKIRLATGYEEGRGISPLLSEKLYSIFIGAGGLYSTAQDMLIFLSFNLGKEQTSLNAILPIMQTPYHTFNHFQVGLGWKIEPYGNTSLFFLEGTLFGFATYMGIVPEKDMGVVILANQGDFLIESLGEQILHIITPP